MAAPPILNKRYNNFLGLDLKSTDLVRPIEFASDTLNAQYTKTGAITKRLGYQARAGSNGGSGTFVYAKITPLTSKEALKIFQNVSVDYSLISKEAPELLTLDADLNRLTEAKIAVSYTGVDPFASISLFFDETADEFLCTVEEGLVTLLTFSLGVGVDELVPVTVTDLASAITALTDFTAAVTGSATVPAAFAGIVRAHNLSGSNDLDLIAYSWDAVNTASGAGMPGSVTNKNDSAFELASHAQINNILYLSNGYDPVHKYDGQNFYYAGLPNPTVTTALVPVTGLVVGTNYFHTVSYIQKDAGGNSYEGNSATVLTGLNTTATDKSFNVTVKNIEAGTGYNTGCAIADGAYVSSAANPAVVTVDDGSGGTHTHIVGNTAYFLNTDSGDYEEREIVATTGTSISLDNPDTDSIAITDGSVISNNLRIAVYRNKTSAGTPSISLLVAEIPNDSFNPTQVFFDDVLDANLGAEFIPPATDRSPPPRGRYLSAWRNHLLVAGNLNAPRTLYWSDVDGPEFFPSDRNSIDTQGIPGDRIKGISPNNETFAIFLDFSYSLISGDIAAGNIRVDHVSHNVGLASHHTLREVRGAVYYLSREGPRFLVSGQLPKPLGVSANDVKENSSRVDPIFDQIGVTGEKVYNLSKAFAVHDNLGEKYLLFLPAESTVGADIYSNENSIVLAFDYTRDAWLKWDTIDFGGGAVELNKAIWFQERRYSSTASNLVYNLYRFKEDNDSWDYEDHNKAIVFEYKSQWEHMGEPSVFKKYLDLKLFSVELIPNNSPDIDWAAELDFVDGFGGASGQFCFSSLGWGDGPWGDFPWGDLSEPHRKLRLGPQKAKALRIVWLNSQHQATPIITAWEIQASTPYKGFLK